MPRKIEPSERIPRTENIFRALLGYYGFGENCGTNDEEIIVEVLTDLRFLCDEYGGIFDRCNKIATARYEDEKPEAVYLVCENCDTTVTREEATENALDEDSDCHICGEGYPFTRKKTEVT